MIVEFLRDVDIYDVNFKAGSESRNHPTEDGWIQQRATDEITITINARLGNFKIKEWGE